jgi:membrane-associated phospholipid phosphatase
MTAKTFENNEDGRIFKIDEESNSDKHKLALFFTLYSLAVLIILIIAVIMPLKKLCNRERPTKI